MINRILITASKLSSLHLDPGVRRRSRVVANCGGISGTRTLTFANTSSGLFECLTDRWEGFQLLAGYVLVRISTCTHLPNLIKLKSHTLTLIFCLAERATVVGGGIGIRIQLLSLSELSFQRVKVVLTALWHLERWQK